jgi:acetate kinase
MSNACDSTFDAILKVLQMNVLVLNSGRSTLKFQVIATDLDRIQQHRDERLCRGEVGRIGGEAIVTSPKGEEPKRKSTSPWRDVPAVLDYLVRYIASDKSGISEIKTRPTFTRSGIASCMAARCSRSRP